MTILAAAVMVVSAVIGVRLLDVCEADVRVARAQYMADSVALAAVWGDDLAREAAARNGGVLDDIGWRSGTVTVIVEVDGVTRAASAA